MFGRTSSRILATVCVGGGLLLTFISGLYIFRPFIVDGERVYFGFPSPWFEAVRGGLFELGPWHYYFLWTGFIIDLLSYSSLVAVATYVCFAGALRLTKE